MVYDSGRDQTTFNVNVNYISNPFSIEFTTNGDIITTNLNTRTNNKQFRNIWL